MNFRTNQVLQFYVAKDSNISIDSDSTSFWFNHTGEGGASRTDVIDKDKVLYITATTAAQMEQPTKKFTITAPSAVEVGKDYVVKVLFSNYQGYGDADMTVKVGAARAKSNSVPAVLGEIAWTLVKNLKSEYAPLVKVFIGATEVTQATTLAAAQALTGNLVIEEALQDEWVLGVTPNEGVNFSVMVPALSDGTEWATPVQSAGTAVIKNGRKVADLEYFAMGERGDQYRNIGWPNVIRTKYMIDPAGEYDIINIHYAFVDSNEGAQKSERDLMIAGESGTLATLLASINTAAGTNVAFEAESDEAEPED